MGCLFVCIHVPTYYKGSGSLNPGVRAIARYRSIYLAITQMYEVLVVV